MKRRLTAAFLCLCLLFTLLPVTAFAEGEPDSGMPPAQSALCEHHTQHDESCGYTEGTAEISCSHEHTEDCYTLVTECIHEHTAECYPAEDDAENTATPSDAEEAEPTECTHECSEESGCITKTLDCKHQHDEACGYVPSTEGTRCNFVCEVCNVQDSGDVSTPSDTQLEECICETLCTEDSINMDCLVCSVDGADLTVCKGTAPAECTCETLCTGDSINMNCLVCSVDGADLTACKGTAPAECTCETLCTEEEVNANCSVCSAESADLSACKGTAPEECTCETLCTEEEINADCSVCSAEGAELDKVCVGAAPMLPVTVLAAGEHDSHSNSWTELTADTTTLSGGSYYLSGDVEYSGTESITVSGEVILCLNGQELNLNRQHISVGNGASLTLCDCSTGGVLTGGSGGKGGGVYVNKGGTFTMTGGNIVGNTANAGGGVYVDKGGTFTMEDGSINNNKATSGGGGGVMVNEGSFTLSGGSITGNATNSEAFGYGGGVCLYGTFYLSGDSIIQNNTKASTADNLYLGWNTIKITGPLGEYAHIGVNAEGVPRTFISGWSNNMAGENPADYFSSDGDNWDIGLNTAGEAVLGSLCTTITLNPNGGILPEYSLVEGAALPIPTKTGYTFAGWYENPEFSGNPVTDIPTNNTENLNFYAKWTANTYTVTFDANGGSVSQTSAVTVAGKLTSLPTPTYDGYDFLGWYTDKDGGDEVTINTVFTKDTTIYAHWQNIPVTSLELNKDSLTLQEKDSDTLTATVKPDDATNQGVTWESSDTSIATVSEDGTVTAISAGIATITATAQDGSGVSASCSVTVTHGNMVHTPKKDATCTADGNKEYWTCDTCGKLFSDENATIPTTLEETVIKATGHKLTKTEAKAPTCTENGNTEYWTCSNCKKYFSDAEGKSEISLAQTVISATGHKLTKTERKEPTCTADGNEAYWTCDTCGKHFGDAEGRTEIALEETVIKATGHKLTKTETKEPTCTADGNETYWTCDTCGKHFNDAEGKTEIKLEDTVIKATGHKMTKTEDKAPTCTADGNEEYWTCDTCGKHFSDAEGKTEIKLEDTVIKATGHGATELKNQKDATCTEEGYTGDKVCKDCGTVLEKGKTTPKIAHNYKDGKCTVCGAATSNYKPDTNSPQTGDNSNMMLWMVMLFVSAGILGIIVYVKQKKQKNS